MKVFRCYTEKRENFTLEAIGTFNELREYLGLTSVESVRILSRYDIEGISEQAFKAASTTVFSEPQTDLYYDTYPPDLGQNVRVLVVEALPGQYDQRAVSCEQCLELLFLTLGEPPPRPTVRTAKVYAMYGSITDGEMEKIRGYLINSVESREADKTRPETLMPRHPEPAPAETLIGFIDATDEELEAFLSVYSLAMDAPDLRMLRDYFRDAEKRNPTITELRVLDTYWSDHCRHTTFFTHLTDIKIDDPFVNEAYESYLSARREAYGEFAADRPQTLMDIATIAAKALKTRGLLTNIEESEEVNACSIHIDAVVDGRTEDWLLMFKNETHNHPTEVEPFGGAATCVGGAIRDPLSGRAYVYQAMRITGSGDPRAPISETMPNKLPQRKLTITAAQGNSSYGNQIGLSSGLVHEIYHPGYIAKRMELGAVVGAVKAENVIRETPAPGDKVILLGGRTGRDGIGGATGSSKSQTIESLVTMAAEVQKGDAVEERKIQRLFLDPEVTKMIKKCNDFGAGGVCVAVGELADGLDINLSLVRTKYSGLDGTEIAISESQERMAIVVAPEHVNTFIKKAEGEGLEAYVIADVTSSGRMVMNFDGKTIVDLSREFLSTNGAAKQAAVHVPALPVAAATPAAALSPVPVPGPAAALNFGDTLKALVGDIRFCSQRGLYEMFDGTIGTSGVLMKSGGKTGATPTQVMAALLPVRYYSETTTCSVMAYGFDPVLSSQNPFIGAKTAVISSVAKLVSAGCDPGKAYLSFQEYFERLRGEPTRWGKPFSALLGAFEAQMGLEIAAIGGKDSMSGSFNDLDVPPTLVSFAVAPSDARNIITPEFKKAGSYVVLFPANENLRELKKTWKSIHRLIEEKVIISAWTVTDGGILEGIFKMSLGNELGFEFDSSFDTKLLSETSQGAIIAEVAKPVSGAVTLGMTSGRQVIKIGYEEIEIGSLVPIWENELESIFPTKTADEPLGSVVQASYDIRPAIVASEKFAKPRVLNLTFPGTNSELDVARSFSRAGGEVETLIVRNMTPALLRESVAAVAEGIKRSQIVMLPGGSSLGDEPDGSAKFINLIFREKSICEAISEHLNVRDGLMLGICNGFQALIKLGLVPFGQILIPGENSPTLSKNLIGRHQSKYVHTRICSVSSPWMSLSNVGDVHILPVSHGDGRLSATPGLVSRLASSGQIATQYTDVNGTASMLTAINPNGSVNAIEGLFSPDGRVFGKMAHTERASEHIAHNIYGNKHQPVFESGIYYFK